MSIAVHISVDCYGVSRELLNDETALETVLRDAAQSAKCEVLGAVSKRFSPQGASVALLLAESHLTIHTWPEHDYAAVDLLTCGQTLPEEGLASLLVKLAPQRHEVVRRGRGRK